MRLIIKSSIEEKIKFEYARKLEQEKIKLHILQDEVTRRNNIIQELNYYVVKSMRIIRKVISGQRQLTEEMSSAVSDCVIQIEELLTGNEAFLMKYDLFMQYHSFKNLLEDFSHGFNVKGFDLESFLEYPNPKYARLIEVNNEIRGKTYNNNIYDLTKMDH